MNIRTVSDCYREMSAKRAQEIMHELETVTGNPLLRNGLLAALVDRIARLEIEIERINDSRSLRG